MNVKRYIPCTSALLQFPNNRITWVSIKVQVSSFWERLSKSGLQAPHLVTLALRHVQSDNERDGSRRQLWNHTKTQFIKLQTQKIINLWYDSLVVVTCVNIFQKIKLQWCKSPGVFKCTGYEIKDINADISVVVETLYCFVQFLFRLC